LQNTQDLRWEQGCALQDMIKLKQLIPEDYCLSCKGCCRFSQENSAWSPKLLEEEKNRLEKIRILADPQEGNFICAFLNKRNNKCKIYHSRPFECQLYPFVFNGVNNKVFLAMDLNCAFIKENLKTPGFKDYTQSLTNLIKNPGFLNLLKDNPHLIQNYEGVLALAVLDI
jgi:Fe-S-cluster containining protein